ncbi:MAG: PH domain-containing protein [Crocinitomicaceae bacterium]
MVFKPKKDWFFPVVLLFVGAIYSAVAVYVLIEEEDHSSIYGLGLIFFLLMLLFLVIQKTTSYRIDSENKLICKMLFLKKIISISEIKSIEDSNGLYVGWKMNTSWKCLVVKYNKYDELLISPSEESEFIQTLLKLNPLIHVKSTP